MMFTVAGFSDEAELDRFIKAEIRYLKSSTLTVDRLLGDMLLFSTDEGGFEHKRHRGHDGVEGAAVDDTRPPGQATRPPGHDKWDAYISHVQAANPDLKIRKISSDAGLARVERIYEFP